MKKKNFWGQIFFVSYEHMVWGASKESHKVLPQWFLRSTTYSKSQIFEVKKFFFSKIEGSVIWKKNFFWVVGLKKNFKAKFLTHFKTRVRKFGPIPNMSSYLNLEFWPLTTLFRPFLRGRGVYNGSEKWVAGFKNFKNYSQKNFRYRRIC